MTTAAPKIIYLPPEKWDAFRAEMRARFEKDGKRFECNPVKDANRQIIGWDYPCEDGSVIRVGPLFHPWIAHERNTWPHIYMTTKVPLTLRIWNGHHWKKSGKEAEYTEKPLPVGTRVKIVMVSRFGHVGLTDDLTAETGYHVCVLIDEFAEKFSDFSMKP